MQQWIHNLLIGAAYIVGYRNPRVDEIRNRSDAEGLRSDWQAVGDDMRHVVNGNRDKK